jgi:hypothetical protein
MRNLNTVLRKCLKVGLMNRRAKSGRERKILNGKRDKGGFSLPLHLDRRSIREGVNVLELAMIDL